MHKKSTIDKYFNFGNDFSWNSCSKTKDSFFGIFSTSKQFSKARDVKLGSSEQIENNFTRVFLAKFDDFLFISTFI